jgi:hypothetical protein
MDSGLLDVIVPPTEFYPDFSHTLPDPVFNDSAERVKWRTKQNYDFAYLMAYAQKRGRYYLQVSLSLSITHVFYLKTYPHTFPRIARRRRDLKKRLLFDYENVHPEAKEQHLDDCRILSARLHRQALQIGRAQLVYKLLSYVCE